MLDRLDRANSRFGVWLVRISALIVIFGANHGTIHWLGMALFIASFLIDGYVWVARRRRPTGAAG